MKARAIKIKADSKSSRMPNHLPMTKYKYHPCKKVEYIECIIQEEVAMSSVLAYRCMLCAVMVECMMYLCMLIVERMEVLGCNLLLAKGSDCREALKCCGDVGIHWTAS